MSPGRPAGSAVKPRPRPASLVRARSRPGRFPVHQELPSAESLARRRSSRCREEVEHQVARIARRGTIRVSSCPASASGSPFAPPSSSARSSSTTRRSAACPGRLLGPDQSGRHVRHPSTSSRLNVHRVALRVPQDRVVLARPPVARPSAVVVRPHDLVQEALRPRRPRPAAAARGARCGSRGAGRASRPRQHAPPSRRCASRNARYSSSGMSSGQAMWTDLVPIRRSPKPRRVASPRLPDRPSRRAPVPNGGST